MKSKKIKILIVDDQTAVRNSIKRGLSSDPEIEVVGDAKDAYEARDKILELKPDVMTLDVEMPKMNGIEFLQKLMPQYPIRVIMVSGHTTEGCRITFEALELGALDFITKPDGSENSLEEMYRELKEKIKIAAKTDLKNVLSSKAINKAFEKHSPRKESKYKLIAIGASTGGTTAIRKIISGLPKNFPGIVIAVHMPPNFTRTFAERIKTEFHVNAMEAVQGDIIENGKILVAPGGLNTTLKKINEELYIRITKSEKIHGNYSPALDMYYESIANSGFAKESIGVILTGMGSDGAKGIKSMREKGAMTLGQDEASSVVYGMPRVAFEIGGIVKQVSLDNMAFNLKKILGYS